jgi:MoaA/NifB/PqqE/SkfB family radical SAM enzyme
MAAADAPLDFSQLDFVYVELTVKCNLRCQFCDNDMRNLYRDVPAERFRALIDQLKPGTRLGLHGLGEPTLHKDLLPLVAYAKAHGLYVYFNSNHTVTTDAQMRGFVEHELDELRISMSAGSREGFAQYAGRDLFDALVERTGRMMEIRGARQKPLVRLIFVLTQQSWPEFPAVVTLADRLRVDELQVQTFLDWGKARLPDEPAEGCRLDAATLARARETVLEAAGRAAHVRVVLPFPPDGSPVPESLTPGRCQWPFNAIWITADGHATPCCNLHDPRQVSFGNVFERPLDEVWLGERYRDFRRRYRADQVDWCRSCPVHYGRFKSYTYERPRG